MNCTLSETKKSKSQTINYRRPLHTIEQTDDTYLLHLEVPGCNKESISISLEKKVLSIKATRTPTQENRNLIHREIQNHDYELKLKINVNIDEEKISAKTEDGVLTVSLPITEEAKAKTIEVA